MENIHQRGIRMVRGLLGEARYAALSHQIADFDTIVGTAYERQVRRNVSATPTVQGEAARKVNRTVTSGNIADFVEGVALLEKVELPIGVKQSMTRMGYNVRAIYPI